MEECAVTVRRHGVLASLVAGRSAGERGRLARSYAYILMQQKDLLMTQPASDEMTGKVSAWLTKTGFPLEMRVAKTLRQLGPLDWMVESNYSYTESLSGVFREGDVRGYTSARKGELVIWSEFVVECKSTSSPWVVLKDTSTRQDRQPVVDYTGFRNPMLQSKKASERNLWEFQSKLNRFLTPRLPAGPEPGYGVVEAFKPANGRDAAFAAAQQVMDAANYAAKDTVSEEDLEVEITLVVPVIVTTSPVFNASFDASTEGMDVRQVERSVVRMSSTTLRRPMPIEIVNVTALESLLADLTEFPALTQEFLEIFDDRIVAGT